MFQIKIGPNTSAPEKSILVYLLLNADGKTAKNGFTPATGDIKIYKSTDTAGTTGVGIWSEHAGVSGLYNYQFADSEIDTLDSLTFKLVDETSTDATTKARAYVKEVKVVTQVQQDGLHTIVIGESAKMLCYLTDDATDLVPQPLLVGNAKPALSLIKVGGTITASGAWTELDGGLYFYSALATDTDSLGYIALVAVKDTVRTFVKEMQIVALEPVGPEIVPVDDIWRIPIVDERFIRASYAKNPVIGKPKYAATRPKRKPDVGEDGSIQDGTATQEFEIIFYPAPNAEYTLEYRYTRRPVLLDETKPFPQGTAYHAETILASCLAVAEARATGSRGAEYERYQELLAQSKQLDEGMETETADSMWPSELTGNADQTNNELASAPGYNFATLRREIGGALGVGQTPSSWTHIQDKRVDRVIQSGYRQFLYPPIVRRLKNQQHSWTFIKPTTSLAISLDADGDMVRIFAPANFASIEGDLTFSDDTNGYNIVSIISEKDYRRLMQNNSTSGRPLHIAIRADVTDSLTYTETGVPTQIATTRWEFLAYPKPDGAYTLEYQYNMNPFPLVADNLETGQSVVPFGSPIHAETILSSCLAEAELEMSGARGPRWEVFMSKLESSISQDLRAVTAEYMGYNADHSDLIHSGAFPTRNRNQQVTHGGSLQ